MLLWAPKLFGQYFKMQVCLQEQPGQGRDAGGGGTGQHGQD
jgi:hypothetical protein